MTPEQLARRTALMAAHGAIAFVIGNAIIEKLPGIDHGYATAAAGILALAMLNAGLAFTSLTSIKHSAAFEAASLIGLIAWPLGLLVFAYGFTG